MKTYKVGFRPRAEADLNALYDYLVEQSGEGIAGAYIERIGAACLALATFPERGTLWEKVRPPVRTLGFEGRAIIVFRVTDTNVQILRILYGGQDLERVLSGAVRE